MSGNGSSYQNSGNGAKYEPIPIESNGRGSSSSGGNKKWLLGAILVVVLAAIGLVVTHKTPGASTDAAVAKADLPVSKTGKLQLFDSHSE
jgi:hypothetical protein